MEEERRARMDRVIKIALREEKRSWELEKTLLEKKIKGSVRQSK